ncbi:MAG: hypothetical protein HND55_09770 [Pseudomonadota bacterium]|nr:MAG: hypothetical protein HND55_09770 [Pseudomonadota bacterium]
MARKRHPNKTIETAVQAAEAAGWRIEMTPGGHCWARMYCPWNDPECRCGEFCIASIWSTPRNPENHARQIIRVVERCSRNTPETDK